ncbi:hypothetical protein D5086_008098 [Populus alba]|uniref:Uncharacterized protein n=1 Tax=Populus alba TaxID=43335 RepID=A0ACC4CFI1_POPAL
MLKTLSLAQHPNVVPILGFSQAPGERIIVMGFVSAVSLDYYLPENSDGASSVLDWSRRLRIAAGAARGLEYLHGGMAPTNEKRGLVGYVDDEFWSNGGGEACKESDVYGFGVVLLELLTGRRTEEGLLVRWALPFIKEMRLSELLDQIRLEVATILNNLEIELCA